MHLLSPAEWYEFARSTVQRYQLEKVKAEEDQQQKKRQEIMELLAAELNELGRMQNTLTKPEFLKFLYQKYPPKNPKNKLEEVRSCYL